MRSLLPGRARAADVDQASKRSTHGVAPHAVRDVEETAGVARVAHELCSAGRHAEAVSVVEEALQTAPDNVEWIFARGRALFEWGRYRDARAALQKAADLGADSTTLLLQLGWSSLWTSDPPTAERWMRKAIDAEPTTWLAHFGLASALKAQDKSDEALASFARAAELAPENVDALLHLADARLASRQPSYAEEIARRALAIDPRRPKVWTTLGITLISQDRFDEAIEAFTEAYRLERESPSEADTHLNLGICLVESGRLSDALAFYESRLPTLPSAGANLNYAHALLMAGRLQEGWIQYEFRWLQQPLLSRRLPLRKPRWDGQDLHGKTILLRSEQGVGDVIQFVRYAPHVKALGARVLMEVRLGVGELANAFEGIDEILDTSQPYPAFDYHIHLMSLPRVFGTDLGSVPGRVPYLRPEEARREQWRQRLSGERRFKVGLVWAGDPSHLRDRYRSVALAALAPLAIEGVQLYSLQKGPAGDGLPAATPPGMSLVDLGPDLKDFADTAAVIDELDLVICVDTSVAHLAGALGKPVWVLIARPPDFRWMATGDRSPWYPTMRLFRQSVQGEWGEVIDRVAAALQMAVRASIASVGDERESPVSRPLLPTPSPRHALPGLTGVAETICGIVQYFPEQPVVGESIRCYGEFLRPQIDVVCRLIEPGSVVLDVCPGIGMHALAMAAAAGASGHFILYEPRPLFHQVLKQNLAANGVANATCSDRALGTVMTGCEVRVNGDGMPRAEIIDDLRLDALHWLKVEEADDVVGTLRGAAQTLWRLRPKLFIACADDDAATALAEYVRDFGYQCWKIITPLFNPANFNSRDADIFSGRHAIAVLAIPEEREAGSEMHGHQLMMR